MSSLPLATFIAGSCLVLYVYCSTELFAVRGLETLPRLGRAVLSLDVGYRRPNLLVVGTCLFAAAMSEAVAVAAVTSRASEFTPAGLAEFYGEIVLAVAWTLYLAGGAVRGRP